MRISILAFFLCSSTMALCQSTPSGSVSFDKLLKGPSLGPPSTGFDKLPPNWQTSTAGSEKTFTELNTSFSWQWDKAQIDSKTRFHLILPGTAGPSATPLLERNYPFLTNLFNQWPNAKGGPIPTQWPNAKLEEIPTQWPNAKLLPIQVQPSLPVAAQTPVN